MALPVCELKNDIYRKQALISRLTRKSLYKQMQGPWQGKREDWRNYHYTLNGIALKWKMEPKSYTMLTHKHDNIFNFQKKKKHRTLGFKGVHDPTMTLSEQQWSYQFPKLSCYVDSSVHRWKHFVFDWYCTLVRFLLREGVVFCVPSFLFRLLHSL